MNLKLKFLLSIILVCVPCVEVCAEAVLTKDAAGIAAGHYSRNRVAYRDAGASGEGVLWDFSGVDLSGPGHKVVCEGDTLGRYRVTGDRMTATHTAELVALHHRFYLKGYIK